MAVFVADADLARFESDPMLRSAVERQLEITGEALTQLVKLSPELAAQWPELDLKLESPLPVRVDRQAIRQPVTSVDRCGPLH